LDVSGVIMHDLDDINDTIVKSIADSIEPACKNH
jgi:hypothetical protein